MTSSIDLGASTGFVLVNFITSLNREPITDPKLTPLQQKLTQVGFDAVVEALQEIVQEHPGLDGLHIARRQLLFVETLYHSGLLQTWAEVVLGQGSDTHLESAEDLELKVHPNWQTARRVYEKALAKAFDPEEELTVTMLHELFSAVAYAGIIISSQLPGYSAEEARVTIPPQSEAYRQRTLNPISEVVLTEVTRAA